MIEIAPGLALEVEDSTENHWIGVYRRLVMVFAYEGSHDDLRHVEVAARAVERIGRREPAGAKLLFALPPLHAKPPTPEVRDAIVKAGRRLDPMVERGALVVAGDGFSAALHRAVATGVIAYFRPKHPVKVERSVRGALASLLDEDDALEALVKHGEMRLAGPARP